MTILGISIDAYISSAALITDGNIIAAAAEERFTREKRSRAFPSRAIDYCLEEAKLVLDNIDYIAVAWNPAIHLKRINWRFSETVRWRAEYLYSVPNHLLPLMCDKEVEYTEQILHQKTKSQKIIYVNHHLSHAANAFFLSPFSQAAILTADGFGEEETALYALGKSNKIEKLNSVFFPHSLGLFYRTFTEFLGFKGDSDEWKVMALASYGNRNNDYYYKIKKIINLHADGKIVLDLKYFSYYLFDQPVFFTESFINLFGPQRKSNQELDKRHYAIASALQQVTEEVLANMLTLLYNKTRIENLVVGGGVFMNSVFNGKIIKRTPFKKVFISSCPDDSGVSIGAALYVYNNILNRTVRNTQTHNYYGPEFNNKYIKEILQKYNIEYDYIEEIEKYTANLLSKGEIVGWFQGRMEFGQRALGNRSILADPRDKKMKDKINKAIKYRETFRPFAPAILEDYLSEYFICNSDTTSVFMEKVLPIKIGKQNEIPSVVHIDGTGRLQTVNRKINQRFYKLIKEFYKITNTPILLNTSFNLNGEPIVCTPTDAIRTFYSSGLDMLIMENYIISKKKLYLQK